MECWADNLCRQTNLREIYKTALYHLHTCYTVNHITYYIIYTLAILYITLHTILSTDLLYCTPYYILYYLHTCYTVNHIMYYIIHRLAIVQKVIRLQSKDYVAWTQTSMHRE